MPNARRHRLAPLIMLLLNAGMAAPGYAATASELPPPKGCDIVAAGMRGKAVAAAPAAVFPPIQLDMHTPLEPTVLAASGRHYLLYELHLRNFSDDSLTLRGLEVIAADPGQEQQLAQIPAAQLRQRMRIFGAEGKGDAPQLAAGQSAVAFLCLAFDANVAMPGKLRHRVILDGASADGPAISTHQGGVPVLGRPMAGTDWIADNGPGLDSHHRMGLFVAGGQAQLSRRYALDWKKYSGGRTYAGNAKDVHAYFSYGQDVLAVASGTVVEARDGQPDNIPRTMDGFTPAVPVTMDSIAGNFVTLALGDGQFAQYLHLRPGSLRVKAGDRVRQGQVIAQIGNSGDARVPHLHFQVASNATVLASEGLPFVIDQYRIKLAEGVWERRTREYPIGDAVLDFGVEHDAAASEK